MDSSLGSVLSKREAVKEAHYSQFIELLANMAESAVRARRYVVVKKPAIDPLSWIERQMLLEERRCMDDELTAELLGTRRYRRIA
ncbi:hypothetical protein [Alicyclobacillus sp. ALC3]|uniref:hypothetical protein n=1 Tax=Alicyclobacillus sp. ALC3 TaxID=2796143 RepID=UPI002379E8AA|nr:hypothetical protein [Alicyclobacillus sp. ALC3]WDL99184.1 hypothetical protein JC200_11385 [Alicyclobacillus sp. ALC3]